MPDRLIPADHAEHRAMVQEAKEHLGKVAPRYRAQLARFLDLGEEPESMLLLAVLDADLVGVAVWTNSAVELGALVLFLRNHAPTACHGSHEKRLAWQARIAELVATEPEEDVDPETADTDPPPPGGVVFEEREVGELVPDLVPLPPPGVVLPSQTDGLRYVASPEAPLIRWGNVGGPSSIQLGTSEPEGGSGG